MFGLAGSTCTVWTPPSMSLYHQVGNIQEILCCEGQIEMLCNRISVDFKILRNINKPLGVRDAGILCSLRGRLVSQMFLKYPELRIKSCWRQLTQSKPDNWHLNLTNACFDIVCCLLAEAKRWNRFWHPAAVLLSGVYCFSHATQKVWTDVLIEAQDSLALWGQSQLYPHSRRLCNGRFDWDTAFPDKGISIQKHLWPASRESFTQDDPLPIRRGGRKQGAKGPLLVLSSAEDGDKIPES